MEPPWLADPRGHGRGDRRRGREDGDGTRRGGRTDAGGGRTDAARGWTGAAATIPELAAASARRVPDRVAVSVDGQPVSHGQLDAQARQAAAWLAGRLGRGERMLLAAGPGPGFLRWYLGALRAGVVVVLANPGYTPAELGHLVADSGARLAVADPGPAGRLGPLAAGLPVVAAGDPPRDLPPEAGRALPAAGDIALLAYTSGTTGRPKGVPLTHQQLTASIQGAMTAWRWAGSDVLVHALPLFHQHGLGGVHATLIAGSTAHLRSRFDPADLIATVRAEGGTVLFGVPATYQALLDCAGGAPLLRGLRLAVCGSAPLSPALAARLPGLLGQLPLIRYGTTESGLDVSNPLGAARPDTVGLPLPGVECRIWSGGGEASGGGDASGGGEASGGGDASGAAMPPGATRPPGGRRRRPARTARSSSGARRSSTATGTTPRPRRRRSRRTAGSGPATSGPSTRPPATWSSGAGPRS